MEKKRDSERLNSERLMASLFRTPSAQVVKQDFEKEYDIVKERKQPERTQQFLQRIGEHLNSGTSTLRTGVQLFLEENEEVREMYNELVLGIYEGADTSDEETEEEDDDENEKSDSSFFSSSAPKM